jgi:hypothetical protein
VSAGGWESAVSEGHIPEDLAARFLGRLASRVEERQVVAHLLTGCRQCAALVGHRVREGSHWRPRQGTAAAPGGGYDDVFRRLADPAPRAKPE